MVGIVDELLNTEHRWNDTDGNTEVLEGRGEGGRKTVLEPFCPPQILYGLPWDCALSSVVRGWRINFRAMERPTGNKYCMRNTGKSPCTCYVPW